MFKTNHVSKIILLGRAGIIGSLTLLCGCCSPDSFKDAGRVVSKSVATMEVSTAKASDYLNASKPNIPATKQAIQEVDHAAANAKNAAPAAGLAQPSGPETPFVTAVTDVRSSAGAVTKDLAPGSAKDPKTDLITLKANVDKAQEAANGHGLDTSSGADSLGGLVNNVGVQAGYIVFNPYTISQIASGPSAGKYKLTSGGAQSSGFLEAIYKNRFAWRWDATNADSVADRTWVWHGDNYTEENLPLDFEVRSGFTFGNSSSQTSSSIGSGDGYGDIALGLDFYRAYTGKGRLTITTAGLEGFGGFNTERDFSRVHTYTGVGLAVAAGIPLGDTTDLTSTGRAEILVRIGQAWVDVPRLGGTGQEATGGTTNTVTLVQTDANGLPSFTWKPAVQANFEARFALNTNTFLGFGGTYSKLEANGPDSWLMYASVTLSIEQLQKIIVSPFASTTK